MGAHKVLVVEDEFDIANLIRLHLKDIDCDVTLAADGHEGMRRPENPDHVDRQRDH